MVTELNKNDFNEIVKNSTGKVLVDCYAVWCGPCQMLSPIVDEVAEETDFCTFYKLNVDEAEEIASEYGIMSIPTLLLFENGELKNKAVGFMSKTDLKSFVSI